MNHFAFLLLVSVFQYSALSYSYCPRISPLQRRSQQLFHGAGASLLSPDVDTRQMSFSTLNGKALAFPRVFPTLSEVKTAISPDDFKRSTPISLAFAAVDVTTVAVALMVAYRYMLPLVTKLSAMNTMGGSMASLSLWALYSVVTGTLAIGMWVTAHECGHKAFSDNKTLQDVVGYVFHSVLLVPYFSWQRSHALHHANTNHIEDGETHVPPVKGGIEQAAYKSMKSAFTGGIFGRRVGESFFGAIQSTVHLVLGWPMYLLFGATGGPSRGFTNHFIPVQTRRPDPFPGQPPKGSPLKELFPRGQKAKVWLSDIGILGTIAGLLALAKAHGGPLVLAAYGGPWTVVNMWLVGYTWLQHTDVDVPHLPREGFSFIKGAFHTIDRPYRKILWGSIDWLHHKIGSTHVLHHIDSTIPHYRADTATQAIKEKFPNLYLYESTPIFQALWRVATKCFQVEKRQNQWNEDVFVFYDDI
jgi:fatty acid desaturase